MDFYDWMSISAEKFDMYRSDPSHLSNAISSYWTKNICMTPIAKIPHPSVDDPVDDNDPVDDPMLVDKPKQLIAIDKINAMSLDVTMDKNLNPLALHTNVNDVTDTTVIPMDFKSVEPNIIPLVIHIEGKDLKECLIILYKEETVGTINNPTMIFKGPCHSSSNFELDAVLEPEPEPTLSCLFHQPKVEPPPPKPPPDLSVNIFIDHDIEEDMLKFYILIVHTSQRNDITVNCLPANSRPYKNINIHHTGSIYGTIDLQKNGEQFAA